MIERKYVDGIGNPHTEATKKQLEKDLKRFEGSFQDIKSITTRMGEILKQLPEAWDDDAPYNINKVRVKFKWAIDILVDPDTINSKIILKIGDSFGDVAKLRLDNIDNTELLAMQIRMSNLLNYWDLKKSEDEVIRMQKYLETVTIK